MPINLRKQTGRKDKENNMFNFMSMMNNHEDRKVDRYNGDDFFVSTVMVTDSRQPFETAVCHPLYNNNDIVIVELYDTKEEAQEGHNKWVEIMTLPKLPPELRDVSSASVAELLDDVIGEERRQWGVYKRKDNDG
jgi:hypothetical protein